MSFVVQAIHSDRRTAGRQRAIAQSLGDLLLRATVVARIRRQDKQEAGPSADNSSALNRPDLAWGATEDRLASINGTWPLSGHEVLEHRH